MSKLWNLLESRLSNWITLKDDEFSDYEVTQIIDNSLDIKSVESFIYRNLNFLKEKNMVKIHKNDNEEYFLLNREGLIYCAIGWDLTEIDEINELRYMMVKEFIENNSKKFIIDWCFFKLFFLSQNQFSLEVLNLICYN